MNNLSLFYVDALKNQAKRPRKRYYHAQGVKNILSVCRDVLDKPNVPVNWDSIISRYDEDSEHEEEEEEEDSDDSDTESINGLGIYNIYTSLFSCGLTIRKR